MTCTVCHKKDVWRQYIHKTWVSLYAHEGFEYSEIMVCYTLNDIKVFCNDGKSSDRFNRIFKTAKIE